MISYMSCFTMHPSALSLRFTKSFVRAMYYPLRAILGEELVPKLYCEDAGLKQVLDMR